MTRERAEASNCSPVGRHRLRNERWRRFGAMSVEARISFVPSSGLAIGRRDSVSSLGKVSSMDVVNLCKIEDGA